jgi:hypothetical protein
MEEVLNALKEINGKLDTLNKKFDIKVIEIEKLKWENQTLKETVGIQEQRIEQLEKQYREKKLIIHGIKEENNESVETLRRKIEDIMKNIGVTRQNQNDIVEVRRIGKQMERKDRPIQLEMLTVEKRNEIFRKKKQLKGRDIWIKEDLPEQVRQHRRDLFKVVQEERRKGNTAYFAYNKLIVNGKIYNEEMEDMDTEQEKPNNITPLQRIKDNSRTHSQLSPDEEEIRQYREKILATNIARPFQGTKN